MINIQPRSMNSTGFLVLKTLMAAIRINGKWYTPIAEGSRVNNEFNNQPKPSCGLNIQFGLKLTDGGDSTSDCAFVETRPIVKYLEMIGTVNPIWCAV